MFKVGKRYPDSAGHKWKVIRRLTLDDEMVIYIVRHRLKIEFAVRDTDYRATIPLGHGGFTMIYAEVEE